MSPLLLIAALMMGPAAAAPAAPAAEVQVVNGGLTLPLGRTVTLRMNRDAPVVASSREAGAVMREALMAYLADQGAAQQQNATTEAVRPITGARTPPTPGQVRMTFGAGPDRRSVLLISENGYEGQVLDFRARMRLADGRVVPTSVCRVPGGMRVVESWSDPITALELDGFEMRAPSAEPAADLAACD